MVDGGGLEIRWASSPVGSNPTPCASRTGVMATCWTHSPALRGSNPGSAIEDANSNSYIITLLLLSCVLFVSVKI